MEIIGSNKGIGLWATLEDIKEPEDKLVLGYQAEDENWSHQASNIVQGDKSPREVEWKPKARPPNKY